MAVACRPLIDTLHFSVPCLIVQLVEHCPGSGAGSNPTEAMQGTPPAPQQQRSTADQHQNLVTKPRSMNGSWMLMVRLVRD